MNPPFVNGRGDLIGLRTHSEGRSSGIEFFIWPTEHNLTEIILKVDVHNPHEFPHTTRLSPIEVTPGMVYRMAVQVETSRADVSMQQLDTAMLPCSLSHKETLNSCQQRCRYHYIWKRCHCVLYTHAVLYNNGKVKICGGAHLKCIADLATSLDFIIPSQQVARVLSLSNPVGMVCECKPVCSDRTYLTNIRLMARETMSYTDPYSVYIDVFYVSKWATGYVKRSKLNLSDLIVGLGGVSGLYLGVSFISLIEMFLMLAKIIYTIAARKHSLRKHQPSHTFCE